MIFVLFGLWILFNGRWTGEIAIVGVVLSAALYLLMWKFMDYSPRREWQVVKRLPQFALYCVYLLGEIFKSAWATMRLIWSPKMETEPRLVTFRSRLKSGWGKVTLANSITLTPGTITVCVRGQEFLVHCLDKEFGEGIDDSEMEKRILEVEGDVTK